LTCIQFSSDAQVMLEQFTPAESPTVVGEASQHLIAELTFN
jgi:hypothetical protein